METPKPLLIFTRLHDFKRYEIMQNKIFGFLKTFLYICIKKQGTFRNEQVFIFEKRMKNLISYRKTIKTTI